MLCFGWIMVSCLRSSGTVIGYMVAWFAGPTSVTKRNAAQNILYTQTHLTFFFHYHPQLCRLSLTRALDTWCTRYIYPMINYILIRTSPPSCYHVFYFCMAHHWCRLSNIAESVATDIAIGKWATMDMFVQVYEYLHSTLQNISNFTCFKLQSDSWSFANSFVFFSGPFFFYFCGLFIWKTTSPAVQEQKFCCCFLVFGLLFLYE